jgi:hypothetical protein
MMDIEALGVKTYIHDIREKLEPAIKQGGGVGGQA